MRNRFEEGDEQHLNKLLNIVDTTNNSDSGGQNSETESDFDSFAYNTRFQLDTSLKRCDWKGREQSCGAANFSKYFTQNYGGCYTFNSDLYDRDDVPIQNIPGSGNGLKIWVNIEQEHYTEPYKGGHHEAGLKFAVHNKGSDPNIDSEGMTAPPGFHTYVAVRQSQFTGLPMPYTKCVTDKESHKDYNRDECISACERDYIKKQCGCQPSGYVIDDNTPKCSTEQTGECVSQAIKNFRSGEVSSCPDTCPHPCEQTTYDSAISMAVYPSENTLSAMSEDPEAIAYILPASDLNATDDDILASSDVRKAIAEEMRKNWVYLDVYFDQLTITSYTQIPSITWSAMLSDIGGQMGLFVGCSVITIAEILEYLIRKIYRLFTRVRPSNQQVLALEE